MKQEQAVKNQLLVLELGSAATTIINKLRKGLDPSKWDITVVHLDDFHTDEPGLAPFGTDTPDQVTPYRHDAFPDSVDLAIQDFDHMGAAAKTVAMTDGRALSYKYLVIA